jgi:hypothetical protein
MAVVVLEIDEGYQVAVARALVEAPQCSMIAAADPNSNSGHMALADSYEEAAEYAQEHIAKGWRAVVWEVPNRRPTR